MQPLDRTVFGPFKRFFHQGADKWMLSHPGKTFTIYDLPGICAEAWDRGANPLNVKSGFRCTGLCPFDRGVFSEDDFLSCYVTDRPLDTTKANVEATTVETNAANATISNNNEQLANCSSDDGKHERAAQTHKEFSLTYKGQTSPTHKADISASSEFISPSKILPYPKASPKKKSGRGPVKKRSIIATDTPERDEIAAKQRKIAEKKVMNKRNRDAQKVKKKILTGESSEEDEDTVPYDDSSSGDEHQELITSTHIQRDDYVICIVHGKTAKSARDFVAKVCEEFLQGYEVQFLKRHIMSNRFMVPDERPAFIKKDEVVVKLPPPIIDKGPRYVNMIYFNIDLAEFSIV